MNKKAQKRLEEVLKNGTPSDLYALIPAHARGRFAAFARCFGIKNRDIAKLNNVRGQKQKTVS